MILQIDSGREKQASEIRMSQSWILFAMTLSYTYLFQALAEVQCSFIRLSLFSEKLCLRADVHRPRGMSSFWSSTRVFKVSCWIKSWLHMAQHLTPWVLHDPFVPALDTSFKNHYPWAQAIWAIVLKFCASKTRTTPLVTWVTWVTCKLQQTHRCRLGLRCGIPHLSAQLF